MPAFILFSACFIGMIIWIFQRLGKIESRYFALAWGMLLGLSSLMLHNISHFNFVSPASTLITLVLFSMTIRLLGSSRRKRENGVQSDNPSTSKRRRILFNLCIRLLAGFLCFISIKHAVAAIPAYQAELAIRDKDYVGANAIYLSMKEANKIYNPRTHFSYGKSLWNEASQSRAAELLEKARVQFDLVNEEVPIYGKAWLYSALTRMQLIHSENRSLTRPEWEEIYSFFELADQRAGNNPWVNYVLGTQMLIYKDYLDESDTIRAIELVQKAIEENSEEYLAPSLNFLWEKTSTIELLMQITPKNYHSYLIFVEFLHEQGLSDYLNQAYEVLFRLQKKDYKIKELKGIEFLKKSDHKQALETFRKALEIDSSSIRAKAGVLIAQEELSSLSENYLDMLQQVLADEDEDIGDFLPLLKNVVYLTKDPYVTGLYAFRMGNYHEAYSWFERAQYGEKVNRRYLAESLWHMKRETEAINLLKRSLHDTQPDLRDLYLLRQWDSETIEQLDEMIMKHRSVTHSLKSWWGREFKSSVLDHKGELGLILNLEPGQRTIKLEIKGIVDAKGNSGHIIFRLQNKVIKRYYANHTDWRILNLPVSSSGGKRWFSAELVNGSELNESERGPLVILGNVEIL